MPLPQKGSVADYVIVGGGAAGCVLAARLSEDPDVTVLLVEAGGQDRSFLFHWPAGFAKMTKGMASWGWSTVPQSWMQDRAIWFTQARVIGGGSSINAQIYTRGNHDDYDHWAMTHGCAGWSHREVLPYFKRAECNDRFANDYHGTDGPLSVAMPKATLPVCDSFIRAAQEYGIPFNPDFNGSEQAGVGFYQLTQQAARRCSTSVAYLRPALLRPNLTVLANTQALRIMLENGRATGVEVEHKGKNRHLQAIREVIVSAGAIGSPRLLLLSGIGPTDHLNHIGVSVAHDLPGVGENLQDHIDICALAALHGSDSYDGWDRPHKAALAGLRYLLFKTGPAAASLFEAGGFWYSETAGAQPDIQLHLGQGSGIEKGIVSLDGSGITLNSANVRPRSRGTVRLASDDPLDPPLIDPRYWSEGQDLEVSLQGLKMVRDILAQPALRQFVSREVLPGPEVQTHDELFDYACRMAKTDHHPVGTCKMGHDEMAVVSPDLRVQGLDGLRICDSSIMPQINASNTNAPTIMIAEKGADLISGRAPLPPAILVGDRTYQT